MMNKLVVYTHNRMYKPVIYVPKKVNFSNGILSEKASYKNKYIEYNTLMQVLIVNKAIVYIF